MMHGKMFNHSLTELDGFPSTKKRRVGSGRVFGPVDIGMTNLIHQYDAKGHALNDACSPCINMLKNTKSCMVEMKNINGRM